VPSERVSSQTSLLRLVDKKKYFLVREPVHGSCTNKWEEWRLLARGVVATRGCVWRRWYVETTTYRAYPAWISSISGSRYIFQFDRHVFPMSDRKMAGSIGSQSWITRLRDNDGVRERDRAGNPIFPWKPLEILSAFRHSRSINFTDVFTYRAKWTNYGNWMKLFLPINICHDTH